MNQIISNEQYSKIIALKVRKSRLKQFYITFGIVIISIIIGLVRVGFSFEEYLNNRFIIFTILVLIYSLVVLVSAYITKTKYFNHSSIKSYIDIDNNTFKHPIYVEEIHRNSRATRVFTYYGNLTFKDDVLTVLAVKGESKRNREIINITRDGSTIRFFARKYDTLLRYKRKIEIQDFDDLYTFYTYPKYSDKLFDFLKNKGFKVELYTN